MSKDGGPAFASVTSVGKRHFFVEDGKKKYWDVEDGFDTVIETTGGLSKLDYFAAAALQGMLCNGFMPTQAVKAGAANKYEYVVAAYVLAEAMLAESERRSK